MEEPSLLQRQIEAAPAAPGCYLFKDANGKVLYVGKAVDLSRRVPSYLRPGADGRPHIPFLMERAESVEFVVVSNEKEALVLENNLIKRLRPRYNIVLASDDKTFVSVRVDMRHDYPRATIVHKYRRDGAVYLGPFASAARLYKTLEVLRTRFPLRLCSDHVLANRARPCMYHELGACVAPCMKGKVDKAGYRQLLQGFMRVLQGKDDSVARELEQRMQQAAAALEFEKAAQWRDRLLAVRETTTRQRAQIGSGPVNNQDVIGLHREADRVMVALLMYRDGKLEDTATRELQSTLPDDEVLAGFTSAWYSRAAFVPEEVVLALPVEAPEALASWLADRAQHAVRVTVPQRGDKAKLAELAVVNARHAMKVRNESEHRARELLRSLQDALGLERLPLRMECYDISHGGQGRETVGAGVCFADGEPARQNYRKYHVKSHDRNDDFASLHEVLTRRLKRGLQEGDLPDLVVIDGGPAQLGRVQAVFDELNVVGIDLVSLAKSRDKSAPGWETSYGGEAVRTPERVFVPGRDEPLVLDQRSPALFLLMRIRDEAHRFAVTFHRKLKRKQAVESSLDTVPGLGPKRKKALIQHFGSPRGVKLASLEQLQAVPGIPAALAQAIFERFADDRAGQQNPA